MDLGGLNQTKYEDLISFIVGTINLALSIAALIAVAFLVYAGLQYILSRGDGEKAEKAQRAIIYTLLGLVLVFLSPMVVRFVLERVLNV